MKKISKIFKSKLIKENKKSLIVLAVIIVLTLVALIFQKSYAFEGASGTSGTCNWIIDTNGKMIIEPSSSNSCTLDAIPFQQRPIPPWYRFFNDITSVEVKEGVKANTYASYLFYYLSNATTIDVRNLDTSNVTNMSGMFYNCTSLTSIDVSNFDTSKVTDMYSMFYNCTSLTSIDVSSFNTSNVTSMSSMFSGCSSLTSLDVSNFNTSNVTYMSSMFSGCSSLTSLDVSNFNTSNVTSMSWMFRGCSNLKTIYVTDSFNTSNVTSSNNMFQNSTSLVGGNGTAFDSTKTDKEYARIDTTGAPGYFTLKRLFTFIKTDKKTGDPVEGVTFKLYGTSDGGEEINKIKTSRANGKVTFEDIPKGTYKLKETGVPDGYIKSNDEITVEVKR